MNELEDAVREARRVQEKFEEAVVGLAAEVKLKEEKEFVKNTLDWTMEMYKDMARANATVGELYMKTLEAT